MRHALLSLMLLLSVPVATAQEPTGAAQDAVVADDASKEDAVPAEGAVVAGDAVPAEGTVPAGDAAPGDAVPDDATNQGASGDTADDGTLSPGGSVESEDPEVVPEPLTGAPPERPAEATPDYCPAEVGVPPMLTLPPAAVTAELPEEAGHAAEAQGEPATSEGEPGHEGPNATAPAEAEHGSDHGADQGRHDAASAGTRPHDAGADGSTKPVLGASEEAEAESLTVFEALSHSMLTRHGAVQAVRLGFLALLFLLLSLILERQLRRLAPSGLVPGVVRSLAILSRGAFVPLVLLSVFALTPRSWGWVEPLVVVVIAVAAGWASREVLTDIFAGMVLTI